MATAQLPDGSTVELPEYASEATLSNLLSVMSGMSAEQQSSFASVAGAIGGVGLASQVTATQSGKQTSHLSNISHSSNKNVRQSQAWFSQVTKHNKDHKDWMKKWMGGQTPQLLRGAANMLSGQGGLKNLLDLLPGPLAQLANVVISTTTKFADVQRTLTDVGQGLGASITATTQALTANNLGIADFQKIASQYGTTLDYLNDSTVNIVDQQTALDRGVNKGALRFAQLSDKIQDQMKGWGSFGLKVEEINQYLGEFLNADRKRGVQAETSTSKLAQNFDELIRETSLYAIDTGRNRKEMIKNQIEALSREDAAGHAMMLREQGQTEAAEQFEKNLALVSNELFARFGTAGDEVKEMLLQAVMQGRGLEATDSGAEFGALFGEAGGVLNDMIRIFTDGNIDPAMFDQLSIAMKNSQNSFDAETYAILQHSNQTMQLMKTLRTEERRTTQEGRNNASDRLQAQQALNSAGEDILKGDRLLYKTTAQVQSAMMEVVETITGSDGFSKALDTVTESVNEFADILRTVNKGVGRDGKGKLGFIGDVVNEATAPGLAETAVAGGAMVGGQLLLNKGLGFIKGSNAEALQQQAQKSIIQGMGAKVGADGSINVPGVGDVKKGGTFVKDGIEYKNTTGLIDDIKPTKTGLSKLKSGLGVTGRSAGYISAALSIYQATTQKSEIEEAYNQQIAATTNQEDKERLEKEKQGKLYDLYGRTASGMAGTFAGAKLGATLGSFFGPVGTLAGGAVGSIAGTMLGEEGFEYIKEWLRNDEQNKQELNNENQSTIIKKFDALIDKLDQLLSENTLQSNAAVAVADNTRKNIDPIRPATYIGSTT